MDRIGQRPTSNFIRNRPSVKLCPIENRYFILAELSAVLRDDGEDRQIFLWSGSAQRKNFYQTCTVSSIISDGRRGGEGIMFDPRGSKGRGASRGHVNGLVSFSGQGKWPMSFGVIDGDAWNAIRHAP